VTNSRTRLLGAGCAVVLLAAAGCGGAAEKEGPGQVSEVTGPAAATVTPWAASGQAPPTTITICMFAGPELESVRKLSPQFTAFTQGTIEVKFVAIPTNSSNQGTLQQLRSKSSTCDIVDQSTTNAGIINQYLEPLEPFMEQPSLFNAEAYDLEDFPAGLRSLASSKDGLVALPYGSDTPLLMYRKDLMEKWGVSVPAPPEAWTWDDLYAAVRTIQGKLEAKSPGDPEYPIAVGGASSVSGAIFALQAMWSTGGDPLNADGKGTNFTDPKAVEGLQKSVGLRTELDATSPGTASYDYAELQTALLQGRTAMAIEWNAAASDLDNPAKSPKTAGKMAYAMLPYTGDAKAPRSFLSTHTLALNKSGVNKNAAFSYVVWYTSKDVARQYVKSGAGSSGRTSLLTDPAFASSQPQLGALNYSLELAHPLPEGPYLPSLLTDVIGPNSNAAYSGTKPVPEAMQGMQTAAEELVKKAGG
jgi:ABC-type glycerol-3-phosphate transport system substrate-binding protein